MRLVECCLSILLITQLFTYLNSVMMLNAFFPPPPPPGATLKYKICGAFERSLLLHPPTKLFEIV